MKLTYSHVIKPAPSKKSIAEIPIGTVFVWSDVPESNSALHPFIKISEPDGVMFLGAEFADLQRISPMRSFGNGSVYFFPVTLSGKVGGTPL